MSKGTCRGCGASFTRKHPSQKFCSPVKGRRLCKDRYHNKRRFDAGDITRARAAYIGNAWDDRHPFDMEP